MADTAAHRPYKFIEEKDERPEGYDVQKHVGRRARAAVLTRAANRRSRKQARTSLEEEKFDQLAPAASGRHGAVYDAY